MWGGCLGEVLCVLWKSPETRKMSVLRCRRPSGVPVLHWMWDRPLGVGEGPQGQVQGPQAQTPSSGGSSNLAWWVAGALLVVVLIPLGYPVLTGVGARQEVESLHRAWVVPRAASVWWTSPP